MTIELKVRHSDPPERFTFARHETFHLRDGWLFKGLRAVQDDANALYEPDAHHSLGIGINMLRSLLYWVQATNLILPAETGPRHRRPLQVTELGDLVQQYDPFLEDHGTLWLLHLELASNRSLATFWYWVFNEYSSREFTEERLVQGIGQFLSEGASTGVVVQSLIKDARCFLRTYIRSQTAQRGISIDDTIDSPLTHLGLIRQLASHGHYKFEVGPHPSIPLLLFAYSLYRFRERTKADQIAISLEELRWAPLSPGRLLCLDMNAILELLERLQQTRNYARLSRSAGLNIVTLDPGLRAVEILREYYAGAQCNVG